MISPSRELKATVTFFFSEEHRHETGNIRLTDIIIINDLLIIVDGKLFIFIPACLTLQGRLKQVNESV